MADALVQEIARWSRTKRDDMATILSKPGNFIVRGVGDAEEQELARLQFLKLLEEIAAEEDAAPPPARVRAQAQRVLRRAAYGHTLSPVIVGKRKPAGAGGRAPR